MNDYVPALNYVLKLWKLVSVTIGASIHFHGVLNYNSSVISEHYLRDSKF